MSRPTPRPAAGHSPRPHREIIRPAHFVTGGALALTAVIVLAGCGGSSSDGGNTTSAPATTASPSAPAGGGNGSGGGPGTNGAARGPAASGQIAAISGTTMQVQSQRNGQVAVTWTASTKFTQQVTLKASAIKAGDCVTAIAASDTSSGATTFAADTVMVSAASNGTCRGGFGGRGGPGGNVPSGFPSGGNFPSGARPSGFPTGGFGNGSDGRSIAIASGSVVSVSGSTIVVAARDFSPGSGGSGSTPTATTTNKTVNLSSKTKITGERSATSSAATVGRCATAQGKADSSGAVTATTIGITDPVDGNCMSGFGGGPGA